MNEAEDGFDAYDAQEVARILELGGPAAVRVRVTVEYELEGRPRMRNGKPTPRGRDYFHREVEVNVNPDGLGDPEGQPVPFESDEGLQQVWIEVANRGYREMRAQGWPRPW